MAVHYPSRGLHGQVVQALGRRIVAGRTGPGGILDLDGLEADLGVSRTAIREALKVLAAKGLVDARPRRGTYVRPRADWSMLDTDVLRWRFEDSVDGTFLGDLAEVREIVEPAGARLAALRRTDDDLRLLEQTLAGLEAADADTDVHTLVELDLRFHSAVLAAAHNELLIRMEGVIETGLRARDLLVLSRASGSARGAAGVPDARPWDDLVPAHRPVLEAIRRQDATAAEAAVRALLDQAARDLGELRPGA